MGATCGISETVVFGKFGGNTHGVHQLLETEKKFKTRTSFSIDYLQKGEEKNNNKSTAKRIMETQREKNDSL